jgi:serine/threonine-protein kinase HipA
MLLSKCGNPDVEHLVTLGVDTKLSKHKITSIIDQTRSALSGWNTLARQYGVSNENITHIAKQICH